MSSGGNDRGSTGTGSGVTVVTGATSGIGEQTVRELAARGVSTVAVGRDASKLRALVQSVATSGSPGTVEIAVGDLLLLSEVNRLSDELLARFSRIDVLVNNAGAVFSRRETTAEGHEKTWALNVLAPFLLTHRLVPRLAAGRTGRVVNVASAAHLGHTLDLADLEAGRQYRGFAHYGRSKLALIVLTYEFAARLQGKGVTVNALHPGFVRTRYGQNNGGGFGFTVKLLSTLFGISPARGARTVLYLATSPEVGGTTGAYYAKERALRSSAASYDLAVRAALWEKCCEATGIPLDALSGPVGVPAPL